MARAALFGLLASSGFIVGLIIGLVTSPPRRLIAGVVAFGSGILISAVTFELMLEAFENGGPLVAMATAVGFLCAFLPSHYVGE